MPHAIRHEDTQKCFHMIGVTSAGREIPLWQKPPAVFGSLFIIAGFPKKSSFFSTSAMIIDGLAEWSYNYKKENQGDGEIEEKVGTNGLVQFIVI